MPDYVFGKIKTEFFFTGVTNTYTSECKVIVIFLEIFLWGHDMQCIIMQCMAYKSIVYTCHMCLHKHLFYFFRLEYYMIIKSTQQKVR